MKKTIFSLVVLLFLISIAIILVSNKNRTSVEQLALDADTKPSQKIPVSVSDKFFSVTVPSKKKTTCIWTYAEGNGGIPYSEKTETEGAVNIHTVANKQITESAYDYGVECSDETGIKFFGEFPGDMQKKFEADSQKKSQNEELNKLNSYISDNDLSYLNTLSGKYTSDIDFFENKVLNNRLSKLLGQSSFSILKNYWNVTSPIEVDNNIFTVSGCQAHNCSSTAFLLVVDTYKNKIYVISKINDIKTYNFEDNSSIPLEVESWDSKN